MKILIAEHDRMEQHVLQALLQDEGHDVIIASTCAETRAKYEREQPDLVLMDIALPDGDGYSCTRKIAAACSSRFAPVILTTSLDDHLTLAKFIESDAIDFVDASSNTTVLKAKIAGYERTREIYRQLESFQTRTGQEIQLAKHMFDSLIRRSPTDIEFLRHWMVTAGHFCGDLLVYERAPSGDLHILMADFTGHGLAAAVGALPTSDVFFAMTRKGFTIGEIAEEANRKLNTLLPTGHFCAAVLARFSPQTAELEIWNGGQPPLFLLDDAGRVGTEVPAFHFPLGVVDKTRFDGATKTFSLKKHRHVVLFSDGLLEAQNAMGDLFGVEGVHTSLTIAREESLHPHQNIKARFVDFMDGMEAHDDVSLLTVDVPTAA